MNPVKLDKPVQMSGNSNQQDGEYKITLRATLVTDPNKNIMVEVTVGDSIRSL